MAYGETIFDIIYLIIAMFCGIFILVKHKRVAHIIVGVAILVLGFGDAFHLIPRMMNYFSSRDLTVALGTGKLITSITMTLFYILLYGAYIKLYNKKEHLSLSIIMFLLLVVRIVLLALPQNNWFNGACSLAFGIGRNIPFFIMGIIVTVLYFLARKENKILWPIWLYIILSFAFYIPVVVGVYFVPMLGMFMIPKTVVYIVMFFTFLHLVRVENKVEC